MPEIGGRPQNLKPRKKGDPALPGAGRPPKLPSIDLLLAKVLGGTEDKSGALEILQNLKRTATSGKASAAKTRAAEILLERGYGKVTQPIDANITERKSIIFVSDDEA